jgi:L-lactate utilization protein LutB
MGEPTAEFLEARLLNAEQDGAKLRREYDALQRRAEEQYRTIAKFQEWFDEQRDARDALLTDLEAWLTARSMKGEPVTTLREIIAKHRVASVPPSGGERPA